MKYQIRFTQGEIAGKCFPLSEDKALTIGRSHSNELKLSAPDVSGRHVVLMLSDGGVAMDNLSSRVTLVDSAPLAAAERKTLMAGQTVTMGSSTAFVLECLPDAAP
ncbi:MAG: FHA domain-containing protein, partial [Victivallales bacterium]|nr:FHA domain-containing protein [Victivallales bacterium]